VCSALALDSGALGVYETDAIARFRDDLTLFTSWSGRCLLSHWMNAQGRMDLALLLYAALTLGQQTPL
jgi:hypothetical protein